MGRSAARNQAVRQATADWLFFLDADDLMHPKALGGFTEDKDALWGTIMEMHNGCMMERYQVPEIDSLDSLLEFDPYHSIQMGHFVRTEIAKANPFDEDMNTGEDWDYYLRVWSQYDCAKVDRPFMVNVRGEHSIGPKSATGKDWMDVVHKLIEDEKAGRERVKAIRC